jgi:hypothetical protein
LLFLLFFSNDRLSFQSSYDFAYLLSALTNLPLPTKETDFFQLLHLYFPFIFDIKYFVDLYTDLYGGLNKLAEHLSLVRIGPQHQAGSDSLLTAAIFFKLRQTYGHKFGETSTSSSVPIQNPNNSNTNVNTNVNSNSKSLSGLHQSYSLLHHRVDSKSVSVYPFPDDLSEFDIKLMGFLAGLNYDFGFDMKKNNENRHKRAKSRHFHRYSQKEDSSSLYPPSESKENINLLNNYENSNNNSNANTNPNLDIDHEYSEEIDFDIVSDIEIDAYIDPLISNNNSQLMSNDEINQGITQNVALQRAFPISLSSMEFEPLNEMSASFTPQVPYNHLHSSHPHTSHSTHLSHSSSFPSMPLSSFNYYNNSSEGSVSLASTTNAAPFIPSSNFTNNSSKGLNTAAEPFTFRSNR